MIGKLLLAQVLGGAFGRAMRRRGVAGGGGSLGGIGLGAVLAGALGGRRSVLGRTRGLGAGRSGLLLMVLPLVMRWVQRNGGVAVLLQRLRQGGYARQAHSWVDRGDNEPIDVQAVEQVVGRDELDRMAQELGVSEPEAATAFAQVLPEMVNQLSPDGRLDGEADAVLEDGRAELERELQQMRRPS